MLIIKKFLRVPAVIERYEEKQPIIWSLVCLTSLQKLLNETHFIAAQISNRQHLTVQLSSVMLNGEHAHSQAMALIRRSSDQVPITTELPQLGP